MSDQTAYTVEQLAERWQCTANHLYTMLREGVLTGFRIGSMVRVSADEVRRIEETPYTVNKHKGGKA